MSILVYYQDETAKSEEFTDAEFSKALERVQELRRLGHQHVIMSNSPAEMVGGFGVDTVQDGKLPDGSEYTWKKRRV